MNKTLKVPTIYIQTYLLEKCPWQIGDKNIAKEQLEELNKRGIPIRIVRQRKLDGGEDCT